MIDAIPQLNVPEREKALLVGEAAFIRAYTYFGLAKRYGGVPIIRNMQEYAGDVESLKVPRSTEKDTWDFVLEECDRAIENLPDAWGGSDARRATKWTAYALKSRAALHAASIAKYCQEAPLSGKAVDEQFVGIDASEANRYYEAAIESAKEIMNSGKFSLYKPNPANPEEAAKNYQDLFTDPNIAPSEAIFIKGFTRPGEVTAHNYDIWYNPAQTAFGWAHPGRFNPTLDFIDLFENYDNPGVSSPIITRVDGQLGDLDGFNPLTDYIRFDSPAEIFKNKDARFFAIINYPGAIWKNVELIIQGGIVKPDGTTIIETSGFYEHNGQRYYTYGAQGVTNYSGFDTYGYGNMTRTGFLMRKFLNEPVNISAAWNQSTSDFMKTGK